MQAAELAAQGIRPDKVIFLAALRAALLERARLRATQAGGGQAPSAAAGSAGAQPDRAQDGEGPDRLQPCAPAAWSEDAALARLEAWERDSACAPPSYCPA